MSMEYPTIKNKVEARQGETRGHMRAVVTGSTLLAFVALGLIYIYFTYAHH